MIYLTLAILCLFLAPVLSWTYHRFTRHYVIIDRLMIAGIALFAVFYLLPESFASAQWLAIGLAGVGFVLPTAAERIWRRQFEEVDVFSLVLAITGFLVHDFLDGAALHLPFTAPSSQGLLVATVLHRLPEGLIIWWVLFPKFGKRLALGGLSAMAAATAAGYATASEILWELDQPNLSLIAGSFEALLAGSLLHLLTHKYHHHA